MISLLSYIIADKDREKIDAYHYFHLIFYKLDYLPHFCTFATDNSQTQLKSIMKRIVIAVMALLTLACCGTTRYSTNVKIANIREFAFIQPCSYMDLFDTDGGYYSQYYSDKAAQTVVDVINSERFPFSEMLPADYTEANSDALAWAKILVDIKRSQLDRMKVPKSLITLLQGSQDRYGVFIYTRGYLTTNEAYEQEKREKATSKVIDNVAEKLTGIQGLTNPSRNYTPNDPYGNEILCVVIDKEEGRLVYYAKKTPTFSSHPTDNGDVSDMLHDLLKDFIR